MIPGIESVPQVVRSFKVIRWFVVAAGALSGCASTDLLQSGRLAMDQSQTPALTHVPMVYESNGDTFVEGWLDPHEILRGGHVDVSIIAPGGELFREARAEYNEPLERLPTGPRGHVLAPRTQSDSHTTYAVRFPGVPPQGSIVRVQSDASPHATSRGN